MNESCNATGDRERSRAELVAAVEAAETSLACGLGQPVTPENMQQLADVVKQHGRERIAAGLTTQTL